MTFWHSSVVWDDEFRLENHSLCEGSVTPAVTEKLEVLGKEQSFQGPVQMTTSNCGGGCQHALLTVSCQGRTHHGQSDRLEKDQKFKDEGIRLWSAVVGVLRDKERDVHWCNSIPLSSSVALHTQETLKWWGHRIPVAMTTAISYFDVVNGFKVLQKQESTWAWIASQGWYDLPAQLEHDDVSLNTLSDFCYFKKKAGWLDLWHFIIETRSQSKLVLWTKHTTSVGRQLQFVK